MSVTSLDISKAFFDKKGPERYKGNNVYEQETTLSARLPTMEPNEHSSLCLLTAGDVQFSHELLKNNYHNLLFPTSNSKLNS